VHASALQDTAESPSTAHGHESYTLNVPSETAPLQQVLVHTPGREVDLVPPDSRLDLLFDDILYVEHAREEHDRMCTLFDTLIGEPGGVLQISDLLRQAFAQEAARYYFVEEMCRIAKITNLQAFEKELKQLTEEELHHFAFTGELPLAIRIPPVPNLMFTRDLAAVVADHIIISHPATAARARENIIISTILHYHPGFASAQDHILKLPPGVTFEGGDVLVASPEVALIGHSERTSVTGVMAAASKLFADTSVEHVVMVDLPKRRSSMHLDTVFTFSGPDECVVFPPLFTEDQTGNVVHFTPDANAPNRFGCEVRVDLKGTLEDLLGHEMTFIPCGGRDALSQEREQWTDGANFFAMAPYVVVGYERNSRTFEAMMEHGYRVVTAGSFLSYYAESPFEPEERLAIKLEGTELSRGRGGPRCMTLPIRRSQV